MLTLPELSEMILKSVLADEPYDELNRKAVDRAGSISDLPTTRNKIKDAFNSTKEQYTQAKEQGKLHLTHFIWKQRQANLAERMILALGQVTPPGPEAMFEIIEAINNMSEERLNQNYQMRRDRFEFILAVLDEYVPDHNFRVEYTDLFPVTSDGE